MKKHALCAWTLALIGCLTGLIARGGLPTPDPDDGGLKLPHGFHALVAADNLGGLRFLTVAPNGDVYARHNNILALHDSKGDGRFDVVKSFGLNGGSGHGANGGNRDRLW